ncbi:MAG: protein kinase [Actinomycetota bacterium]|nr:protein kinase [Actinomycetota bacterium]
MQALEWEELEQGRPASRGTEMDRPRRPGGRGQGRRGRRRPQLHHLLADLPLLVRRLLLAPSIVDNYTSEGSAQSEPSVASYLEKLVSEKLHVGTRVIEDPNGVWVHVDFPERELPERGWKLHVSAIPTSAQDVLDACVPVLVEERTPFKVTATMRHLIELNEGSGGLRQAGKFLTAYPSDPDESVRLARALDSATKGLRGPRVLDERSLSSTSLVHYRFGDYVEAATTEHIGSPPDPFVASGLVDEQKTRLIADRYLITGTLHRSVRGAVHLAVDVIEKRSCVLKRAWRDAIATPDGKDARDRLRMEAELLTELSGDLHFPTVSDTIEFEGDLFVAMNYVGGTTFGEMVHQMHSSGAPPDEQQIIAWGRDLAAGLDYMHDRSFVHRDLNPINVIAGTNLVLIDLELAQPIGSATTSFGAGTEGYVSPNQRNGGAASPLDDIYGLGALLVFAATGDDPDPSALDAEAITRRAQGKGVAVQPDLARVLARCLEQDDKFASMKQVAMALSDAAGARDTFNES